LLFAYIIHENRPLEPAIAKEKWKGISWVGSRRALEGGEVANLLKTGADAISQTPFGWQSDPGNPDIRWRVESDEMWWGESSKGIAATLDSTRKHNVLNVLKPHLWVRGSWPGEIEMKDEGDWNLWFDNYRGFILDYAILAEKLEIPVLCIGTELERTSHREEDWRKVISHVKKVYSGKLIYAANFTEFEHIEFWDELDYIGVQAYFPLSKKEAPRLKDLIKGWEEPKENIKRISSKFQKPVVFTEIGYCNTQDAAVEPWVWPSDRTDATVSEEMQALCYEAFFEAVWQEPWMAGAFWWKWFPHGARKGIDFTPQGKEAEEVLRKYYSD